MFARPRCWPLPVRRRPGLRPCRTDPSVPLPRFDTPSLLGVWATAPYFHDGSAATLREVLFSQDFHNVGPAIDAAEQADLLAFMRSLP